VVAGASPIRCLGTPITKSSSNGSMTNEVIGGCRALDPHVPFEAEMV
jgi:hypothetical protein